MTAAVPTDDGRRVALGTHLANVADNLQFIADLGYGDVSLAVPNPDGSLVVVADARPMTAVASLASTRVGRVLGREVDPFYRYRNTGDLVFPVDVYFSELEEEGGYITKMEARTKDGTLLDPRVLGIKERDSVKWNYTTAAVAYVRSDFVLLKDSMIPTGTEGPLEITPNASASYKEMRTQIREYLDLLPYSRPISNLMENLFSRSAPEVKKSVRELAEISALLHPLDDDTLQTLERFGVDIDEPDVPLTDVLLNYSPYFIPRTKAAGLDALNLMRDDGFDRAEDMLLMGQAQDVLLLVSGDASYKGKFSGAAFPMVQGLLPSQRSLGVRGRDG